MENNESVVAAVIRELQDYVIVRKYEYNNMLCAYKKYMMSKDEIENKVRAELEAEYADTIHTLENKITLLKKQNRKWWQKIF